MAHQTLGYVKVTHKRLCSFTCHFQDIFGAWQTCLSSGDPLVGVNVYFSPSLADPSSKATRGLQQSKMTVPEVPLES